MSIIVTEFTVEILFCVNEPLPGAPKHVLYKVFRPVDPRVAPRGVPDLYPSWGINIEHARTAYHKTCGTEYQSYRRFNSQAPYYKWNIEQERPKSVSDASRSLQSWVSSTHRSYSQLADVFQFFTEYKSSEQIFEELTAYVGPCILPSKIESSLKPSHYDAKPWFLHSYVPHKSPNKCPRRFWEGRPWNFAHTADPFTNVSFFFGFRRKYGIFQDPNINIPPPKKPPPKLSSGKRKQNKNTHHA